MRRELNDNLDYLESKKEQIEKRNAEKESPNLLKTTKAVLKN